MKQRSTHILRLPWFGLLRLKPFIQPYRGRILGMILTGTMVSGAAALYPLFTRYAIDHFIAQRTTDGITGFVLLYALLLAGQAGLSFVTSYLSGKLEILIDRDLRNAAFHHLQTLSFSNSDRHETGDLHSRVMSDTRLIGEILSWRLMNFVLSCMYLLGAFAVMLVIGARLMQYILVFLPAALFLIVLFQRGLHPYHQKVRELNARITTDYHEGITGANTIRLLGIKEKMAENFRQDTASMRKASVRRTQYSILFTSVISLLSAAVLVVVLWRGGLLVEENVLQIGTLSVFLSYAIEIISPMRDIVETMAALVSVQVNIERFFDLLDEQADVQDTPEVIRKYGDTFHPRKENWEPLLGDVELRDVTFRYPGGKRNILEHFNLKVKKGTNVAIVGETGAGKTTLVNLICRFYEPTQGAVLIDGKDVRERSQLWLHSNLGYVLQTPQLFAGTIRENLKIGNPEATDEQIMKALRDVCAETVVRKQEKGLDTYIGEGGGFLSTGEKQLLSFARVILADPKILVLDEATSSVDSLTEKEILQAAEALIRGRTSFVIAHRMSTIRNADRVLVLSDGKIVNESMGTYQ